MTRYVTQHDMLSIYLPMTLFKKKKEKDNF